MDSVKVHSSSRFIKGLKEVEFFQMLWFVSDCRRILFLESLFFIMYVHLKCTEGIKMRNLDDSDAH